MKMLQDIEKLRGFACIIVFVQHVMWICPIAFFARIIPQWLSDGTGGVRIFFAISGFLITLSLKDKFEQLKSDTFLGRLSEAKDIILPFYKKRFFRIMPVVMFVWLLFGIFFLISQSDLSWIPPFMRVPVEIILGVYNYAIDSFVMTEKIHFGGFGPFWTLAVESQFYVLWPIALLLCKNNNIRAIVSLVCGLVGLFFAQPISTVVFHEYQYYALYVNVTELFLGSFFAFLFDRTKEYPTNHKKVVTFFICVFAMSIWFFPSIMDKNCFYLHMVESISAVLVVVLAAFANGSFEIPLVTKFLEFLGHRSFSFYAVQLTIANIIVWFTNSIYCPISNCDPATQCIIFIIVLCLVTEFVYNCIEKPSRKLGRSHE